MPSDIKKAYGTLVSSSGGLTSLGSSADWTVGYLWYIIDNTAGTTTLALDRLQFGKIRVGSSAPTANTIIRLYAVPSPDGTTWPDGIAGTAGAVTWTSAGVRDGCVVLARSLKVDTTTASRDYYYHFSLASLFGGFLPKKTGIYVAHNTGTALNSTAGQHTYNDQPIYATVG